MLERGHKRVECGGGVRRVEAGTSAAIAACLGAEEMRRLDRETGLLVCGGHKKAKSQGNVPMLSLKAKSVGRRKSNEATYWWAERSWGATRPSIGGAEIEAGEQRGNLLVGPR